MQLKVKDIIKTNSDWFKSKNYEFNNPELSIIMLICKKSEINIFKKTIDSFLNQTFKNTELIIIDDTGLESVNYEIKKFIEKDERISCIKHYNSINFDAISLYEGLKKCRGKYIGFLFDGNILYPSVYERTLNEMLKRKADASYGRIFEKNNKYDDTKGSWIYNEEKIIDNIEIENTIRIDSLIISMDSINKIGWLDPHICMKKACFWEFLKRIKEELYFIESGIKFADKNYYYKDIINLNFINEYLKKHFKKENLKIDKFEEYNILFKSEDSSIFFDLEFQKIINENGFYNKDEKNFFEDSIFVYSETLTSSSTLLFNDNCNNFKEKVKISFISEKDNEIIAKSRAIILIREHNIDNNFIKKLKYASIPMYLLWDDDFIELSKNMEYGYNINETQFKTFSKNFNGLIFTSKNFLEKYEKKKYNEKNYLFEPIYLDNIEKSFSFIEDDIVRIAFTGGYWRIRNFLDVLINFLNMVSYKKLKVYFYMPYSIEIEKIINSNKKEKNFFIVYYDITFSYDQLINKLGKEKINILIHPSENNENNKNKTKNALITASLLGSVLITSDDYPYNVKDSEHDPMPYLLVPNIDKYWAEAVLTVLDDSRRFEIVNKAKNYCKNRYSINCFKEFLEDVEEYTQKVDFSLYSNRLEKLSYYSGKFENNFVGIKSSINIHENIIPTKRIDKKAEFYFISNVDSFKSIGIMFGTHNKLIFGKCLIKITDGKKEIFEDIIHLDQVLDNDIYILKTDYILDALNKKFFVYFDFEYDQNTNNKVSLYQIDYKYSNNKIVRNLIKPFRKSKLFVLLS